MVLSYRGGHNLADPDVSAANGDLHGDPLPLCKAGPDQHVVPAPEHARQEEGVGALRRVNSV